MALSRRRCRGWYPIRGEVLDPFSVCATCACCHKNGSTLSLLPEPWVYVDPHELRLLLAEHIPGPGQRDRAMGDPNRLYLPLARSDCRISLTFQKKKIVAIEPGPAFNAAEWQRISQPITKSLFDGPLKFGRDYSFSSFRVFGSWRGRRSGVQILPPPDEAPRAPYEMAEHPFILEFPVKASDCWPLTNYRRMRGHRELTLLLNVLLAGYAEFPPSPITALLGGDLPSRRQRTAYRRQGAGVRLVPANRESVVTPQPPAWICREICRSRPACRRFSARYPVGSGVLLCAARPSYR